MNTNQNANGNSIENYEYLPFLGLEQWKAHPQYDDNDEVDSYFVVFTDEEKNDIRIPIDLEGNMTIVEPDLAINCTILSPEMLAKLANIAKEIKERHQ